MIVDLHAHYPMHIAAELDPKGTLGHMTRHGRAHIGDRVRALVLEIASVLFNYRSVEAGPGVTVPLLKSGRVGVALSVLYSAFSEMDLEQPYGAPPKERYFDDLLVLLQHVEDDILAHHAADAAIVRKKSDLDAAIASGKVALIHAVEGGFHLGGSEDTVRRNVAKLAELGVAYITVAHLFWRQVATNCPALPFLPDAWYRLFFHQPGDVGLGPLGRAMVRAMVDHRVLIDITHMSEASMRDTFALLDEIDPGKAVPVIASHIACRFDEKLAYNLGPEWMKKVAERGGVMGVILCDHYAREGLLDHPARTFDESMGVIYRQIDEIRAVTSSDDAAAIGTDLDGFIKPTLAGLYDAGQLGRLEDALHARYDATVAKKICEGNALRVLRTYWG